MPFEALNAPVNSTLYDPPDAGSSTLNTEPLKWNNGLDPEPEANVGLKYEPEPILNVPPFITAPAVQYPPKMNCPELRGPVP